MTRGIMFDAPTWAKEQLKARKAVYFKAMKEAKKAQAALEKKDSNKVEQVDEVEQKQEGVDVNTPATAVVEEHEKKEEESKEEENKVDDVNADGENDANVDDDNWYLDLGSGDFWPCYLRFMFIAAYKMIESEWSDKEDATEPQLLSRGADSVALVPLKPPKQLVLNTILRVCPPSIASIPPSSQEKRMEDLMSSFGLGRMGILREKPGSLHLNMCNDNKEVISVLGAAGLGPLCDMCRDYHMFIEVLDAGRICKVAALLNKLKPFFAFHAEDLAGTPFVDASPSYANLDHYETMVEMTETFSEIASLSCGVTGIIGL